MANVSSPILGAIDNKRFIYLIEKAMQFFNTYELSPSNWANQAFFKYVCQYVP